MKKIMILATMLVALFCIGFANAANQNDTNENVTIQVTIANSAPTFTSVSYDDTDTADSGTTVDLTPNGTQLVTCVAIVNDADGAADIVGYNGTFYLSASGAAGATNNQDRYYDGTCARNDGYGGAGDTEITCTFPVYFYATPGGWNCQISVSDGTAEVNGTDDTPGSVADLMAIDFDSESAVDFGSLAIGADTTTTDNTLPIYNIGNTIFDLNLESYAAAEDDGQAMSCTGGNLVATDLKYSATPGQDYTTQKTAISTAAAGHDIATWNQPVITSGTTRSSPQNLYLGFGIGASETGRSGACTGTLMVTAITNA